LIRFIFMPELPEVETIRRGLQKVIIGRTIDFVEVKDEKPVRGLVRNFKMTGQLIYQDGNTEFIGGHEIAGNNQNKYTRVIFHFKDKSKLYFNDLRKFGYLQLLNEEEKEKVRAQFGPDPTDSSFGAAIFKSRIKNRRASIKAILLNQKLIAGIGNIYADEACFQAKIRPDRPTNSLSSNEIKLLSSAIIKILNRAISVGGTTFRNYLGSDGKKGNYSDLLCVYGREGQKCPVCGSKILKQKTAGRGTHYCPTCQE